MRSTHWDGRLLAGMVITGLIVVVAASEPWLAPFWSGAAGPTAVGIFASWSHPQWAHPLGTNQFGQDILALTLLGLRNSLVVGLQAGILGTFIGICVGFTSGYFGGTVVDEALRTVTDAWLVIPSFPLIAVLAAFVRNLSVTELAIILGIFSWAGAARAIRAQVLMLRSMAYVDMARLSGAGHIAVIGQELLPNMYPYLGVGLASSIMGAIGSLVGLSIIGLGQNAFSLGTLIQYGLSEGVLSIGFSQIIVVPVLILIALFVGLNLINVGLDVQFNPRLKGSKSRG